MHERLPDKEKGESRPIYVASVRRDGRLRQGWEDAAELIANAEVGLSVRQRLSRGETLPTGEDGLNPGFIVVGRREGLEAIAETAGGIIDHGQAFRAWADLVGDDPEALGWFEEAFLGSWADITEFAEQLIAESDHSDAATGDETQCSRRRALARELAEELQQSGDLRAVPNRGGGVWLFRLPGGRLPGVVSGALDGGSHE